MDILKSGNVFPDLVSFSESKDRNAENLDTNLAFHFFARNNFYF